jgi:hypothetical protein
MCLYPAPCVNTHSRQTDRQHEEMHVPSSLMTSPSCLSRTSIFNRLSSVAEESLRQSLSLVFNVYNTGNMNDLCHSFHGLIQRQHYAITQRRLLAAVLPVALYRLDALCLWLCHIPRAESWVALEVLMLDVCIWQCIICGSFTREQHFSIQDNSLSFSYTFRCSRCQFAMDSGLDKY